MNKIISLLLSALLSMSVIAQDSKPAAPSPAPAAASAPKHQCKSPEPPGKLASNNQQKTFMKEIDAYRDCLLAYRDDMNKQAKAAVEAANAAVEEFNAFVATLNKK